VGALPEQEVRHPLLATDADDQIRVGLPGRVEVVADVGRGEFGGQAVEIVAGRGFRLEERTDGLDELLAAAISDRKRDVVARRHIFGHLDRFLQRASCAVGKEIEHACDVHLPPTAGPAELLGDDLLSHLHQIRDLGFRPLHQILGRADEHRDVPNPDGLAPAQRLLHMQRAVPMSDARVRVPLTARPPAVAVHHHPDVLRHRLAVELLAQTPLVRRIRQTLETHAGQPTRPSPRQVRCRRESGQRSPRANWCGR
jgi:hypothetical protein